jgi:hypothetical protein
MPTENHLVPPAATDGWNLQSGVRNAMTRHGFAEKHGRLTVDPAFQADVRRRSRPKLK